METKFKWNKTSEKYPTKEALNKQMILVWDINSGIGIVDASDTEEMEFVTHWAHLNAIKPFDAE